jgi:cytidyltransferase-like protein
MNQNKQNKEYQDVFVLGVWDLLHEGHLSLLEKASKLGNLTVGIVKDSAVKKQKGDTRPIYSQEHRMNLVSKLLFVYDVVLLDDFEIPKKYIESSDIICIGEDQKHIKNLNEIPFMKLYNLPRFPGISTSDILKKIGG